MAASPASLVPAGKTPHGVARGKRSTAKPAPAKKALKPAQIEAIYSIPPSTLHFYCTKLEPVADRLPSFLLPGRGKKKDTRLVYVHELEAWLEKHRAKTTAA